MVLTHLQRLEAESIQAMREVVAEAENPVMLYSIGKDSAVMLHLLGRGCRFVRCCTYEIEQSLQQSLSDV